MSQYANWLKPSGYHRRGKNLNSKNSFLSEDVGDKRFSMEEVLIVAASLFKIFYYV